MRNLSRDDVLEHEEDIFYHFCYVQSRTKIMFIYPFIITEFSVRYGMLYTENMNVVLVYVVALRYECGYDFEMRISVYIDMVMKKVNGQVKLRTK